MRARALVGFLMAGLVVTSAGYGGPASGQTVPPLEVKLQANLKQMWVNGVLRSMDVAPELLNDRMYVPVRHLADALGADIQYDAAERKVTMSLDKTTIELWIDQPIALINGARTYIDADNLRVTPVIRNGRTMLPLRFVAESLGMEVTWHPKDGSVSLSPRDVVAPTGNRDEPPARAGWYRVSGIVLDARTGEPLEGAQVVARTDTSTTPAPETAAAKADTSSSGPAPDAPAQTLPDGSGLSKGSKSVIGAPGRVSPPAETPSQGETPIPGASPPVYEFKTETGTDGTFGLDLPAGVAHRVSFVMTCFSRQELLVSETTRRDVKLEPMTPPFSTPLAGGMYRIYGQVKDQQGRPVPGACVTATPPAGSGTSAGQNVPQMSQYMTDGAGRFFVDWPTWKPIKVKATALNCEGKGIQISWGRPVTGGEDGPMFVGTGSSPEPVVEYMDIPANPAVAKDISIICVPPPEAWPLAVTLQDGESGTSVCQQSVGTDSGTVRMTNSASAITTGQSAELKANPVGGTAKPVLLRWWLDDPMGGKLYVSGCKATYMAPASLGLIYQTSAYVFVAKEGDRKPYPGTRIMIYNAQSGTRGQGTCTAATYSVTANGRHGNITRLDIQGIGTWRSAGASNFTVTGVPVGRYTVSVTTTGTGTHTLQVQIGCPMTRSQID